MYVRNPGKSGDYLYYCIDISDYDSDEMVIVFEKMNKVAEISKKNHRNMRNII